MFSDTLFESTKDAKKGEREMILGSRMSRCGLILLSLVTIAGCSPSTAAKPESASSAVSGGGSAKGKSPRVESPGQSSLEALRRGEPPVTPASSPLKEIYFEFDRYDLRPEARASLKANADWLKGNPSVRVQIEGHCDERGTTEYNLALGAKRAQAAKSFLMSLGVAAERLSTISYGEETPVCKEHNEGCWQKNRRDRFVISPGRPAL
jgi:peptidoglycan-associated lipoprotein